MYDKVSKTNLDAMIQNMASDERKVFYQSIIEEVVMKDKKVQEDIMKKSLSDGKSDGDVFVRKNGYGIKRINLVV